EKARWTPALRQALVAAWPDRDAETQKAYIALLTAFSEAADDAPARAYAVLFTGRLEKRRDQAQAIRLLEQARELFAKAAEPTGEAVSLFELGAVAGTQQDYARALQYHKQALAIREKIHPPPHADLASSLHWVGWYHSQLRQFDDAIAFYG